MFPSINLSILVQEIHQEGHYSYTRNFEGFLQDINEPPANLTFLGGYTYIALATRTHQVEGFTVSDEDVNDYHTFEMIGGPADCYFEISDHNLTRLNS